jgi:hypothetical protein
MAMRHLRSFQSGQPGARQCLEHLLWVTNIEMAEFLAATALVMLLSQCPDMGGLGRALMQVR